MRYISPRIFVVIVLLAFVACVRAQVEEPPVVSDNPLKQYSELGLPVLEIVTEDDVEPTCDTILPPADAIGHGITNATKIPGRVVKYVGGEEVFNSGDYVKGESGMTIKIRGNTSAWDDKKPYKIKLQKKADLLLRDNSNYKDKNWVLLKDETFRALAGFKVNELIGLQWTPSFEYVNVVMNGDYKGVYMLAESVERNKKGRINVDDSGYLFEFDAYWWNEPLYVLSPTQLWCMMNYTFKYPDSDDMDENRISEFSGMITEMENAVHYGDYQNYIDVGSFARWLIAQDILGNGDPCGANVFVSKYDNSSDTKFQMPCLWDFDRIMEMQDDWSRQHICGVFCYGPLLNRSNKEFVNEYSRIWYDVNNNIFDDVISFLTDFSFTEQFEGLSQSLVLDNQRWGGQFIEAQESIDMLMDWFKRRKTWLSDAINNQSDPRIPTSVELVGVSKTNNDYYTISGIKANKNHKGILINKGKKIIN